MQTIARDFHLPQLVPCRLDQVTKGTCWLNVLFYIPSLSLLLCGTNVAEVLPHDYFGSRFWHCSCKSLTLGAGVGGSLIKFTLEMSVCFSCFSEVYIYIYIHTYIYDCCCWTLNRHILVFCVILFLPFSCLTISCSVIFCWLNGDNVKINVCKIEKERKTERWVLKDKKNVFIPRSANSPVSLYFVARFLFIFVFFSVNFVVKSFASCLHGFFSSI